MIFGMSTACFFPHIYNEDAISLMGRMGIENIEIFFSCLSEYDKSYVKELKSRAEASGIHVESVHAFSLQFEPQLFSRHQRARHEALDIYERVLEAGAELGARTYVFHGPANVKRVPTMSLDFEYVAAHTDPLADMAKRYGIKLAWENVHWCWYEKPGFTEKLLPLMSSDNLYFTLDLKQAMQAGYEPEEYINASKGRLIHIHICDICRDDTARIMPVLPFSGSLHFGRVKKALADINYDAAMILEVYSSNYKSNEELLNNFKRVKAYFSDCASIKL